ncbi:MAG TPA: hypothetical protein VLL08_31390 [Kineosporiaceae bacterium]|nr:hypothetical protein [Kineosporiaceae bacterium]
MKVVAVGLKAVRRRTDVPVLIGDAVTDPQGQPGVLKVLHEAQVGGYLVTVETADGRELTQWDRVWGLTVRTVYQRVDAAPPTVEEPPEEATAASGPPPPVDLITARAGSAEPLPPAR